MTDIDKIVGFSSQAGRQDIQQQLLEESTVHWLDERVFTTVYLTTGGVMLKKKQIMREKLWLKDWKVKEKIILMHILWKVLAYVLHHSWTDGSS